VRVRRYLLVALGVVVALGIFGAGYRVLVYPEQAARAAVEHAFATLPQGWTAHYGSLKYALVKRQLVLTDLTASRGETRVSVSQVSLTGVEGGANRGGQISLREASLIGISAHDRSGDTTVRSMDAADLAGDFGLIFQSFSRQAPSEAMLALPHLLNAKRFALSDFRTASGADTVEIARLVIDTLGHGVIGALSIDDLRWSLAGTTVTVTKAAVGDADVEALQGVFDATTYTPGQKPSGDARQLFRSLDLTSVAIGDPAHQLHLDTAQLAGFRGRPFVAAPTKANAADPRFIADVAAALFLDTVVLHNMKIGDTQTDAVATSRNLEIRGYAGGRVASAKIEDVELSATPPQPFKAALRLFELRGTDTTRWLKLMVDTGPAAAMAHGNSAIEIPYVAVKDLQIGAGGVIPIRLDSLSSESVYRNGQATSSKTSIKSLEIPFDGVPLPPQLAALSKAMQLSRIVVNVEAASRWQPDEKRLLIDGFDVGLDGLGSLTVTASIKGVDPDRFAPDTMAQALEALRFEQLELHYHDASLVARILAMNARQGGITAEQVRANLIQQQEASAAQLKDQPEAAQALQQVAQFLRAPKTLVVTLAPAQPVAIADIAATPQAQLAKLLGLHVVAQ
jgi:hypothetical protein